MTHVDRLFRLIAYVCEGGVVHEVRDMGVRTATAVVLSNVHDCRYAVMEVDGEVRAYDLHEYTVDTHLAMTFLEYTAYPTEDAAIMACVLRHSG